MQDLKVIIMKLLFEFNISFAIVVVPLVAWTAKYTESQPKFLDALAHVFWTNYSYNRTITPIQEKQYNEFRIDSYILF